MISISQSMYHRLLSEFVYRESEKGGLVFFEENRVVTFYVDKTGEYTSSSYKPDGEALSHELELRLSEGFTEFAFIHCHPEHIPLSNADIEWARSFIRLNGRSCLMLFLVQCDCILCYRVTGRDCVQLELDIS